MTRRLREWLVNPDLVPRSGRITQKPWARGPGLLWPTEGPSGNTAGVPKNGHSDVTAMASCTAHPHGYHISAPQCHEPTGQIPALLSLVTKHRSSLLYPLRRTLDRWVFSGAMSTWIRRHMCSGAEPQFPVPSCAVAATNPWSLQHRLQVWKTLHPGHVACGSGKARRLSPNKSAKKQAKLLNTCRPGARLPVDWRQADACQIALDSSVFPWHAPIENHCYSTCYTQIAATMAGARGIRNAGCILVYSTCCSNVSLSCMPREYATVQGNLDTRPA